MLEGDKMRHLPVVLLVFPALAFAGGATLLFPAIGHPSRVTLTGRVLKDTPTDGSSTLSKNMRRLLVTNWVDAPVEVRFAGQSMNVTSGHDGNFEAVFEAPADQPFTLGMLKAEARVPSASTAVAAVEILAPSAAFFVISDFDDTIAVTEVLSRRRLIANSLMSDEKSQPVVKGMADFYGCLRENVGQPAFALVSGSPLQFASRVGTFLSNHRFPPMGLYLRDLGPNTLSDYKQPIIRSLLRAMPNPAVLVGDSGEHDPEVYRQINEEFPERIRRIYIRNAGRSIDKKRFDGMFLFDEPKAAALDAVDAGLASKECVARVFP